MNSEAGDDLVEDEQRPIVGRQAAQELEKSRFGGYTTAIAQQRLTYHG
jgi:hypothetical protein